MTGPHDVLPPDAPATVEDVRASRRWMWVAFAWAVAASVIAVLALIQANKNSNNSNNQPTQPSADVGTRLDRFESQTSQQLDAFGRRLNDAAATADVQKLDKRLTKVEDTLSKMSTTNSDQANTVKTIQTDLQDLTKRVSKLEQQQGQGGTGTGTGTTTTP